jgi:2-phospho-L-lactate/phosphoenolpyruvate guanylyltransferase
MMTDAVWAVVVSRVGPFAKSRLASVLDSNERRHLTLSMLSDVLRACARARELGGVVAVVDAPAARWAAERAGAIAIGDPGLGDMNAAVTRGIDVAAAHAATTVIVLPGDVPLVTPDDVAALVTAAGRHPRAVVVGASLDGQGTNALLLRPPHIIRPAFGPPSVERHVRAGRAAGAFTTILADLGLALDVDTPADLQKLLLPL